MIHSSLSAPTPDDRRIQGEIRAIRRDAPGREVEIETDYGRIFMPLATAKRSGELGPGERVWLSLWQSPGSIEPGLAGRGSG